MTHRTSAGIGGPLYRPPADPEITALTGVSGNNTGQARRRLGNDLCGLKSQPVSVDRINTIPSDDIMSERKHV
jgi:hypothetical protein